MEFVLHSGTNDERGQSCTRWRADVLGKIHGRRSAAAKVEGVVEVEKEKEEGVVEVEEEKEEQRRWKIA